MKAKYYVSFTLLVLANILYAQRNNFCGADEMRIAMLKSNPVLVNAIAKREHALEEHTVNFTNTYYQQRAASPPAYIIPVVFHVIHNYGVENISDAQLKDGLDIVNKTFRRLRPDTNSIVAVFQPIHADCEIEFRLAQRDPNGNCHSGINRIASSLTSIGDHSVKSLIQWPPDKYLNVYVVENAAGLAGHAIFPSDADSLPQWDGIVLTHSYVGTIGTSTLTRSVAFAHECGHYLNLQHIWGGNNVPGFYYYPCADPFKDCNIDDHVADTPPTIGWQSCNLSGASCLNPVDNVQNVMDYSYCNIMFTQGQKIRMHACLNSNIGARNNLWQLSNLIATGVLPVPAPLCAADFTATKNIMCSTLNNQVTFTNTSYNGAFTSVEWQFPGGIPSSSLSNTPLITYSTPGVYDVSLKVKNGADSAMITKQNFISVVGPAVSSVPFVEDFETLLSLHGSKFFEISLDSTNHWEITNLASYSASHSIMLNNYNNTMNTKDELHSQVIDLAGVPSPVIRFKYAFARKDSTSNDLLQVYVAKDCNNSWLLRSSISGAALQSVPPVSVPYFPTSLTEWKEVVASVPLSYSTSTARFKIVFTSKGGNNIFIDDINLDTSLGLDEYQAENGALLYPNPVSDIFNLSYFSNTDKKIKITLSDITGNEQMVTIANCKAGTNIFPFSIYNLSSGMYFVKIAGENEMPLIIKKIVKQ